MWRDEARRLAARDCATADGFRKAFADQLEHFRAGDEGRGAA